MKSLEEWTGRKLLIRGQKGTLPTREGQQLANAIAGGVTQISEACDELRARQPRDQTIVVSALPGFTFNWLFPRLIRFDQMEPHVPVSISTNSEPVTFATGLEDVAIRYGRGDYAGLHVEKLMSERLFPVCAPVFLERNPKLETVADLSKHTLLQDELVDIGGTLPTWDFWAEKTGHDPPKPLRTRRFGQANMVVQAAVEGLGIALGREPLVIDALRDGRLVRPLPDIAESQFSYWFVCSKRSIKSKRIKHFRDWIFAEVEQQRQWSDNLF